MKSGLFYFRANYGLLFLLVFLLLPAGGCRKKNNYSYDLTELRQVAGSDICYSLERTLDLPLKRGGGLAVDGEMIFVSGDKCLLLIDSAGSLQRKIKLECKPGPVLADNQQLFVACTDHIELYNMQGGPLGEWASLGEYAIITSLAAVRESSAASATTHILVADAGNHVLIRYDTGGRMLQRLGEGGSGIKFILPSPYFDVVPGKDATFQVVNPGIHRIEEYTLAGEFRSAWGQRGFDLAGFTGCCNPVHLASLPGKAFFTAEKGIIRIKRYSAGGDFECIVAAPDRFSTTAVILDLAVQAGGRVYVLAKSPIPRLYIYTPREGKL